MQDFREQRELQSANRLIFVKDYDAASRIIEQMLSRAPFRLDLIVHLRRIELAAKLNQLGRLRQEYADFSASEPNEVAYQVAAIFVELHAETANPIEATQALQEISKVHGPSPAIYFGIGMAMEAQANLERAAFNYEQCIALDKAWYPAYFGLSQICYQRGDDRRGDHYFFLFEEAAPYNVYGNFETHRRLSAEFLDQGRYLEAATAITTLAAWWLDNKGVCPLEIQVYEAFALARVADRAGDSQRQQNQKNQGYLLCSQALSERTPTEGSLYFIAKALEDFGEPAFAFRFYKRILSLEGSRPETVQKIGGQFLAMGEHRLACELFDEAYLHHPDNPEIRFCRLVAKLRLHEVAVEDYLLGRERMKQLLSNGGDRVELLALLHNLLAKFPDDPEVQQALGEIYLKLGNHERASRHYHRMWVLDPQSRVTRMRFASFALQHGQADLAIEVLQSLEGPAATPQEREEILWLKASDLCRRSKHLESQQTLALALDMDPWNVSYLVVEIINLTATHAALPEELQARDPLLVKLLAHDDQALDWLGFDKRTRALHTAHAYAICYAREKLHFLYAEGQREYLGRVLTAAQDFDGKRATYDFLRLLNTNFDSPAIYGSLGALFKELWQLETASMWFEQMLMVPGADMAARAEAYLELADCYTWRSVNLPKAIEYARIAVDLSETDRARALVVLGHALLKAGQVREAQVYLEQTTRDADPESVFLKGLLAYRNGDAYTARKLWKPLLTLRSDLLRMHHIKQTVLGYYFEGQPYAGTQQVVS